MTPTVDRGLTPTQVVGNVLGVRNNPNREGPPRWRLTRPPDFCQGHGGGRDCNYSPEVDGCLQHGEDFDHGTVSYCDGTCTEGREQYLRYLREQGQQPAVATQEIILSVWGDSISYEVTFTGADAEDRALAYMSARKGLHFAAVEDRPFSFNAFPRLEDVLYPQCHHGLDLSLCMDPYGDAHFGTREQKLAQGW